MTLMDSFRRFIRYVADSKYCQICAVGIAAVILALPMLMYGPMATGDDTFEHLSFFRSFAQQFWGGELYPRWLLTMNHGLGSPTFFVYPPLPSYVSALLVPVGSALHFNAFNAAVFLALFGSGISAFLWIRTMANGGVALAAAVLYMLMPYHLVVDFYLRTALSECWALAWMPLVLYFTTQVLRGQRGAVAGLAVAYCLLILSHIVSVFIFSAIPLLVAVTVSTRGRKIRSALSVAEGMLLGTGLSCFYFLPALLQSRYFPVSRLPITLTNNVVHFGRHLLWDRYLIRAVGWAAIGTAALIAFGGAMALRGERSDRNKQIALWLAVCPVPIFLMSRYGAPLWTRFPFLFDAVQYQWRLNIVLCLAALPIAAALLSDISWPLSFRQASSLAFVLLLAVIWLVSYGDVLKRYNLSKVPRADTVGEDDGWFDAWKPPGTDSRSALEASIGPRARFLTGNGSANVLLWKPRHVEFETYSATGGSVMINQFYYPKWRAEVVGESRRFEIEAALPEGLLEVQVPPGHQQIRLEIPVGFAERLGRWVSALCVLLCIVLGWSPKPSLSVRKGWKVGTSGGDAAVGLRSITAHGFIRWDRTKCGRWILQRTDFRTEDDSVTNIGRLWLSRFRRRSR